MPGHLLLCSVAAALRDSLVPWRGCEEFSVARAVAWEGMEFGETGPFVLRVLSDSSPVRRDRGRAASEEAGPTPPGFGPVSAPHALPGRRPPRASCFAEAGSLPPSVSYFSGGPLHVSEYGRFSPFQPALSPDGLGPCAMAVASVGALAPRRPVKSVHAPPASLALLL